MYTEMFGRNVEVRIVPRQHKSKVGNKNKRRKNIYIVQPDRTFEFREPENPWIDEFYVVWKREAL